MDTQKQAEAGESPYAGEAGRTRKETVHVPHGGGARALTVYRAVNVATDPGLRDGALALALHSVDGDALVIPFVLHDPAARKLCVVVPEALRHLALVERAALLTRIASDTTHAVPAYARDAPAVVGARELAAYLSAPAGGAPSADVAARENAVAQREERIAARGELLTSREDELRALGEEQETREQDLTMRESELMSRMDNLRLREADLSARESRTVMREAALEAKQKEHAAAVAAAPAAAPQAPASSADVEEEADEEEVEDDEAAARRADDTGVRSRAGSGRPPPRKEVLREDVEEIADEEEVAEEIDELDEVEITGVGPTPSKGEAGVTTEEIALAESKTVIGKSEPPHAGPKPSVPPPNAFVSDTDREMNAVLEDGRVRLHARIDDPSRESAFASADLLLQLAVVQGHPVALLTLVDGDPDAARPYVRRTAVDLRNGGERAVVEALKKQYAARVSLYAKEGRFLRTIDVSAPREGNAALVLERAARAGGDAQVDGPTACERALAAPPPVREPGLPFTANGAEAQSARDASASVVRLTAWSAPEKLDRALLVASVPREVVDATFKRVLGDALRFGIALPAVLRDRAVSVGVASEPGALVTTQIAAFRKTASSPDLGPADIAANWEALLAAAGEVEVAIDGETHDQAWRAIRAVRGEVEGASKNAFGDVDLAKLGAMGPPELVLMLDHPKARRAAALELCRRGDGAFVDGIYKAVRKMPRAEVVRVVPRVVAFGEAAGDALIDGLSARKTFVRQASALGLGQLKLRRAVVPLLHLLESEESEVWREVARVLGELGQSSYRPLLRAAKDGKGDKERFAYALAHASLAGSRKQLRELAEDRTEGARLVGIAQQALVLEDDAKRDAQEVRSERAYDGEDPVKRFSRRFYEELAGTAPEADLDAGPDA